MVFTYLKNSYKQAWGNIEDPDQMTQDAASDRGLHYLPLIRQFLGTITRTCLYNFDPHRPHFFTVKLGFTDLQGYTLIFLFQLKNIDCGYSLESPRQVGSN